MVPIAQASIAAYSERTGRSSCAIRADASTGHRSVLPQATRPLPQQRGRRSVAHSVRSWRLPPDLAALRAWFANTEVNVRLVVCLDRAVPSPCSPHRSTCHRCQPARRTCRGSSTSTRRMPSQLSERRRQASVPEITVGFSPTPPDRWPRSRRRPCGGSRYAPPATCLVPPPDLAWRPCRCRGGSPVEMAGRLLTSCACSRACRTSAGCARSFVSYWAPQRLAGERRSTASWPPLKP
jgi:hypothetical protein